MDQDYEGTLDLNKLKESHTSQVGEQSKSVGAERGDVESLNDNEVLKDQISGLQIIMTALEDYVTSDKQNSSFNVPSDLQSGQRRVVEYAQTKRIAQKFEMMKSELSALDEDKANLKREYDKNFELFWTEYEELKTTNTGLEENLKDANAFVTTVESEKANMEKEYKTKIDELNNEYEKLKTDQRTLEESLRKAYSDVKEVEGEKEQIKKEFDQFRAECEELKTTNKILTEKLMTANAILTAVENEKAKMIKDCEMSLTNLNAEYEKLKIAHQALEERLMNASSDLKKAEGEKANMKKDIGILNDICEKLETACASLEANLNNAHSYKLIWDKHEKQKTDLQIAHRQLEGESNKHKQARADMENLKQEKENLLTRLSKLIGDRLKHYNANIADLSDSDRPTKLSEYFSEIYDNEWTDAFEELTEVSSLSDDDAIRRLLDILMNAFRKCKEFTWDRYESLSLIASTFHVTDQNAASAIITDSQEARFRGKHLCSPNASTVVSTKNKKERETQTEESLEWKTTPLNSTLSIDERTSLKKIWRSSTVSLRNESLTLICAILSTRLRIPETNLPETYKYIKVCCDVCWKMFMQEKPMHLEINAEKQISQEKLFDTERFRGYTKAGRCVAYVVWPALFLHEGGPMLAKGIAQGCNKVPNT